MPSYPGGPRSPGDPNTLRRRPCNAVHCCCEKPVFYQLTSSFPAILFEVPLEVGFVLEFEVGFILEFEVVELPELEPMTEGFVTGGFLTGLFKGEE